MSEMLSRKVGEMEYDGLVIGTAPDVQVGGRTIRKADKETVYKRGTAFAKSSTDNKLVVLGSDAADGETLVADCILCDDITVKSDEDVTVVVYTAGCFNTNKITVKDGYTMTEKDLDEFRKYSIVLKAAEK